MMKPVGKKWALLLGIWALPGLYFTIQVYLEQAFGRAPIPLKVALLRGLVFSLLWAASTPPVLWLARTFQIPRKQWLDGLLFHMPAGLIFSLGHLLIYVFVTASLERGNPPGSFDELLGDFQPVFISNFAWWSLVYWTILISCYAIDYYSRYQEAAIRESRLETELARAELQALKMQLHPHFLFNTLNSISALMHDEPALADRMIARLGEFLRITLSNSGLQETSLGEELRFLECYLDIERIRFQDRLRTKIEVDPRVAEARVPNLLLQPIVENAIRHGIAPSRTGGEISINAARSDGRLAIEVRDNGQGLRPGGDPSSGLGLANTRARLRHIYGEEQKLELSEPPGGGLLVRIEIPFTVEG